MTEITEKPKRKRVYKGKELERRLEYQRQYNQRQRDEAKASTHRPLKPIEIAQQRQPTAKSGEKAEMRQFSQKWASQKRDTQAYLAMLECEKAEAKGGWHDSGKEWFWKRVRE